MENLKLLRKDKKISLRKIQREKIEHEAEAKYFTETLNEINQASHCNEDYFSKLSDELVLQIFKWIPRPHLLRFSSVSRRWYTLMFDESLWTRYDLSNKTIYSEILIKLLNRGVRIFGLCRTEVRKTTRKNMNLPEHKITNLATQLDYHLLNSLKIEVLDLTEAVIDTKSLNILIKHAKNLRKISLESLDINNETFHHLSLNTKIETLNICLCKGILVDGLILILSSLKLLKNFNIGWSNLERESVVLLCKHLPSSIERLNISGCKTTLLDSDVQNLVISCPYLIELDLSDAQSLTGLCVKSIANHLYKLEYLAFSRCYSIQPSSYFALSNLNNLIAIDLFNILKEKSLNILKSYIPTLTHVNRHPFSTIARPNNEGTCIWGYRVIDESIHD